MFSQDACVVFISLLDPIGTIKRASQSTFRVFGFLSKDCVGKVIDFFSNSVRKDFHYENNRYLWWWLKWFCWLVELWHVPTKWIESHSWWDSHEIRWRWLTQGYKCWRIKDVWGEEIWVCVSTSNAPAIGSCNKCRFWSEWILSTDRQRWIRLHTFWTQREDLQYIWKNFQKMFCEMSRRWRLSRKNDIV